MGTRFMKVVRLNQNSKAAAQMLKLFIKLKRTSESADNSLWVCRYERTLSHVIISSTVNIKILIRAALSYFSL